MDVCVDIPDERHKEGKTGGVKGRNNSLLKPLFIRVREIREIFLNRKYKQAKGG